MLGMGKNFGLRAPTEAKAPEVTFRSTKTYTHALGLSCAFRQHKATSHCRFLHGYALQIKITFEGPLDTRNWVQDFGGLKNVKTWLEEVFDHKTLVAEDDPHLDWFKTAAKLGILDLKIVPATGMEKFAEMVLRYMRNIVAGTPVQVVEVEVSEHPANSAIAR